VLYTKAVTEDLSPAVQLVGAVKAPGAFPLAKNMYAEDLVLAAGGFLETAEKAYVYVSRLDRDLEKGSYSERKKQELDLEYLLGLKKTPANPFILENFDVVSVIAPIRGNMLPNIVVRGEVKYPGNVILETDQTKIAELIKLVGGFSKNYNLESSFIERDSLKLFVNFGKGKLLENTTSLQNGDVLVIGSKLTSITTSGGVVNPTVFNWEPGKRAKYYLSNSGGKKKRIEQTYVLQANGRSQEIGFLKNPKVYPGAQIIAMEKPPKIDNGANKFMDDFMRIFGTITGVLTTIVLATKL
jgi:protein involved in polysaccharide export with SLBB domain